MNGFNFLGMWTDFNFQWSNLLFLLIPVGKAIFDVFNREKKGIGVKHKQSMAIAISVGFLISYIDWKISVVPYYIQSLFLGLAYFFLVFDYLRNILAGKKITYVDDNPMSDEVEDSWWDKKIYSRTTPLSLLLLRLWIFMLAMSMYYLTSYL